MEPVWIAFACGLFIGSCLGILILGLISINKDNKLKETIVDNEGRIQELELQRELLKGEIFRLSKNYKPRKPQPRLRRNLHKKNKKNK